MKAAAKIPARFLPDRGEPSRFSGVYLPEVDYGIHSNVEPGPEFRKVCTKKVNKNKLPWLPEDIETVKRMWREGKKPEQIAKAVGRGVGDTRVKIMTMEWWGEI